MSQREAEINVEKNVLAAARAELRLQRGVLLSGFQNDPSYFKEREAYLRKMQGQEKVDLEHAARLGRYVKQVELGTDLKDVSTVVVGMHWRDGHPSLAGELSGLRWLRGNFSQHASWIQAIPKAPRQTWTGRFRDQNGDGVMEFSEGSGRNHLCHLAWQRHSWISPNEDDAVPTHAKVVHQHLPVKGVVRATLKWRELHAPNWFSVAGPDHYRHPLAPLRIAVLKQRDSTGRSLPADVFDVVARSEVLPERLESQPRYAIYQAQVAFQVGEEAGRYALVIEGYEPQTTFPPAATTAPRQEMWELTPELHVEAMDQATRARGRITLEDFWAEPTLPQ
jgi:hypothetical protein